MMRAPLMTALALGTAASLGCAGGQDPEVAAEPQAAPTQTLSLGGAEIGRQSGVQVRVAPATRTSRYQNEAAGFRPVHVEIRNESGRPLVVRHEEFELQQAAGEALVSVPVLRISGDIPGIGGAPIEFEQRDFEIAQEYSEIYPDLPVYEGEFEVTAVDAYRAAEAMEPVGLRDAQLLADALPEGVLRSGGRVAGTIWFEELPAAAPGDSTMAFAMDLVDASTGEEFGEVRIPVDLSSATLELGTETWDANAMESAEPLDVTVLVTSPDPLSYAERRVQLDNVKVQRVVSDRVFWVGPDDGEWLLVTHGDPTAVGPISARPIEEGQSVTLIGVVTEAPVASQARAAWRLDQEGASRLGRTRVYLVADDVRSF